MSSSSNDDRLRNRYEACRSGMHELDVLRAKHTLLIQNLRSRLPVIPGSLDDVQTRTKKSRDGLLDRFSLQSVDSGISSQNTLNSTRSSTPEDFSSKPHHRHSNIYENSSTTMNYSTFRKLSLESTQSMNNNNNNTQMVVEEKFVPPVITSRSCHRGAWKTSPQKARPKSMFDTSTSEYLYGKPPRHPIDLNKERRSAFTVISPSSRRNSSIEPTLKSLSQLSLNEEHKRPLKAEVVRRNKEKADAMFRANVVYVSSPEVSVPKAPVRFSPARSPPVRRAIPVETKNQHYAQPCKIRSPILNSKNIFAAKPIAVRPSSSPNRSTWLQSQPL